MATSKTKSAMSAISGVSTRVEVLKTDMEKDIGASALLICDDAVRTIGHGERELAQRIKKKMDEKHYPTWHVVVGRQYGAHLTPERGSSLYVHLGQGTTALIFKSA